MSRETLQVSPNSAFLPEGGRLRRRPRAPWRKRPEAFYDAYEDRALVYDAFWHVDGKTILLVGPPPRNLKPLYKHAVYRAGSSRLRPSYHPSLSTMLTALRGAPPDTRSIDMEFAGEHYSIPVGGNHARAFAGTRMLFTLSKDNELDWIAEWARWHARLHGTNAVLLFDNGSHRYTPQEIEETMLRVNGIERVAVSSWPWRYGMTDPKVTLNPFYVLYLQVSTMSVALRRFGAAAAGIINADVDELFSSTTHESIYDAVRRSPKGLISVRGRYIEPVANSAPFGVPTHRNFLMNHSDARQSLSRARKWAIDPSRPWFASLDVHPYMHWIEGRPAFARSSPKTFFYRHFRAINTNWKEHRTGIRHHKPEDLAVDDDFRKLVDSGAF